MVFNEADIVEFQEIFNNSKHKIRGFEGRNFLERYQDQNNASFFFHYSYWIDETSLNSNRHSVLFKVVWSRTKALFAAKPEALSVDKIASLE